MTQDSAMPLFVEGKQAKILSVTLLMLAKKHLKSIRIQRHPPEAGLGEGRLQVLEVIVLAAASLEAFINEYINWTVEALEKEDNESKRTVTRLVKELVEESNRTEVKLKWQLTAHLLWQHLFDESKSPWQDFETLIRLRNDLMHYKGQSRDPGYMPRYLGRLMHMVGPATNPIGGIFGSSVTWVDRLCTYEIATWAFNTSVKMIDQMLDFGDDESKDLWKWLMGGNGLRQIKVASK